MTKTVKSSARQDQILIICEASVIHEPISRYFINAGYSVTILHEVAPDHPLENYGAIVHVAHSNHLLSEQLGERIARIADEQWVLMAAEDEADDEDLHCTVELTPHASGGLRSFVTTLWSMFNIA